MRTIGWSIAWMCMFVGCSSLTQSINRALPEEPAQEMALLARMASSRFPATGSMIQAEVLLLGASGVPLPARGELRFSLYLYGDPREHDTLVPDRQWTFPPEEIPGMMVLSGTGVATLANLDLAGLPEGQQGLLVACFIPTDGTAPRLAAKTRVVLKPVTIEYHRERIPVRKSSESPDEVPTDPVQGEVKKSAGPVASSVPSTATALESSSGIEASRTEEAFPSAVDRAADR